MRKSLLLLVSLVSLGLPSVCRAMPPEVSARFTAGPYILDVSKDAAVVAFHLNLPLSAEVLVFDGTQTASFASNEKTESHYVAVTGLSPGRSYRYEVVCGQGAVRTPPGDLSFELRTSGLPGESFTFAVYGDPRPGETLTQRHHQDIVTQVKAGEPLFRLVLGDMVDNGRSLEEWESFFSVESEVARRTGLYAVLGDNDYALGEGLYPRYLPNVQDGYYHFESGGVHFFALNAWDTRAAQPEAELDADSPQIQNLISELSKPEVQAAPFRVVFTHDPVYVCRGRAADLVRRVWTPIFQKYRVSVVFSSWHLYERSHQGGVYYIISGGAGAELIWMNKNPEFPSQVEAKQYHYCRVDVNAGAMTIRAIGDDGSVLDSISLAPQSESSDASDRLKRLDRRLAEEKRIGDPNASAPLPLYLFSYDCRYCKILLGQYLPELARKHGVLLRVYYYDLSLRGTYDLLMAAGSDFGRQNTDMPTVFIGKAAYGGEKEIKTGLSREIEAFKKDPDLYLRERTIPFNKAHDTTEMRQEAFSALTFATVLGAGLLDGLNPCAFTTVILLISYLSLFGESRRQVILAGGMFSLAVFLTYLAIGLFFFRAASWLLGNYGVATIVNYVMLVALLILAAFSFVDFARCLRGRATEIVLQLPGFLKTRLRGRIREYAKYRMGSIAASFALGVVIAGLELTCTGQVYLPIVTMISDPQHRAQAALYLVSYNVMFIIPLLVVLILGFMGLTSQKMGQFFQKHVAWVKLGLSLLFLFMSGIILYNLGGTR